MEVVNYIVLAITFLVLGAVTYIYFNRFSKMEKEIRELADGGHFGPALLLAWATLEAIGRLLALGQFQRPQTPGRLVQVLASEGYLTPNEADELRLLADKRNKVVHGELQTRISRSEVNRFADVLTMMVRMIGK